MAKSQPAIISEEERLQEELFDQWHPNRKMAGSFAPIEGKCGAKVRNKDLAALNITRYCKAAEGQGTPSDQGRCKLHGGSTPTHIRSAMRKTVSNELATLSEQLGEAPPLGPPEIEFALLAAKAKQWELILERQMSELKGAWTSYDAQGVERARAVIELWERGIDRLSRFLEFAMKFDLHKRVVALEEQQAQLISQAFFGLIMSQELGLKEAQVSLARNMFAQSMAELGDALSPSWASGIIEGELLPD